MPSFFIDRPVFAWVIAIFIVLAGLLTLSLLPVTRYPDIAPPSVSIRANYPGASPQVVSDSVISIIEPELSGVKNLLYFESSADTSGSANITATFESGTDPELAQVDVQNKIKSIEPRLPEAVQRNGLTIESSSSNFLMVVWPSHPPMAGFLRLIWATTCPARWCSPSTGCPASGACSPSCRARPCASGWIPTSFLSYSISLSGRECRHLGPEYSGLAGSCRS